MKKFTYAKTFAAVKDASVKQDILAAGGKPTTAEVKEAKDLVKKVTALLGSPKVNDLEHDDFMTGLKGLRTAATWFAP